jgi:hypothetical protein
MKTKDEKSVIIDSDFSDSLWDIDEFFIKRNVNAIIPCAKLYKKELFKSIRYPVGRRYEDEFTTYKVLFEFENIAVVEAEMYYYLVNLESITNSSWSPRRLDVIEAFEERLSYFKDKNLDSVYKFQVKIYFDMLYKNCEFLSKNNFEESYDKYLCDLRKKLRLVVRKHSKLLGISFKNKEDKRIYEHAYPKLMYLYWIGISFVNKFKRK